MSVTIDLSRVNYVGLAAGAICLLSLALPWWGINGLGGTSLQWGLFSTPSLVDSELGTTTLSLAFSQINPLIIALVLLTATVAFLGSFTSRDNVLLGSFANSLFTSVVYVVVAATAVKAFCVANSSCGISGPFGSTPLYSWGFQTGFYLFFAGALVLIGAIAFHRTFMQSRPKTILLMANPKASKFCTNCGVAVSSNAKFCNGCGHSTAAVS